DPGDAGMDRRGDAARDVPDRALVAQLVPLTGRLDGRESAQDLSAAGAPQGTVGDGAHLRQPQVHPQLPGGEDAAVAALSRPARAAPLPERPGALHRL